MTQARKIFIIGDIHGQLGMLETLMNTIAWRPGRDELIFLGDYVDRGPNSKGVLDYLVSLRRNCPFVRFALGNHEDMLRDYISGINQDLYLVNGGRSTLQNYGLYQHNTAALSSHFPRDHMEFLFSLELYIELEHYFLVHAGFRPGIPVFEQSKFDMTWIREPFISSLYDFGKKVIFGHTSFPQPLVMRNKIGLDTGAAYGRRLCCLELPEEKFHFAET